MKSNIILYDDFRAIFRSLRKQLRPHGLDVKLKTWRDHNGIQFEVVDLVVPVSKKPLLTLDPIKNLSRKVWITQPIPHGNGGWCGDKNIAGPMTLEEALKINPVKQYDLYQDWHEYGTLGAIRISTKPDSNYSIYYWNDGDKVWVDQNK